MSHSLQIQWYIARYLLITKPRVYVPFFFFFNFLPRRDDSVNDGLHDL